MDSNRDIEKNIAELFRAILELEMKIANLNRLNTDEFKEEIKHFEIGLLVAKWSLDELYEKTSMERMSM